MASYGAHDLPPMPDFSSPHHSFSTAGDLKLHIQNVFQNKAEQLLHTGNLGQRILTQQAELEARLKEIEVLEADKGEEETRERYHELVDTIMAWDDENAQLLSCFGSNAKEFLSDDARSPLVPYTDLGREEPERIKSSAGTSVAQSRRAKNAAHRADDVEFAFEIGSGLLTEVRRLQSLLGERDKAIQDMKEEKDDLEKSVEGLRTALKQQEQNSDKFKEENWNLEVRFQELTGRNEETVATLQRLESDHKRLTKALAQSRDAADQHKNEGERLANVIEEMKAKHDTDIAQARRNAAGLMRDKSDLQQAMDTLKADVARAGRRLPKYGSPLTPGGPETMDFLTPAGTNDPDDVFGTTGRGSTNRRNLDVSALFPPDDLGSDFADSPDPSPLRKPFLAANHPTNEIEALQQRLAHAQRQINTLKGSLNREKQQRIRLENGQDTQDGEEDQAEGYADENIAVVENKRPLKRSTTPFKVGAGRGRGRGRGRGGITLIQRLGMAAGSPSSDYNDDDQPEHLSDEFPPPVPSIPIHYTQADDEDEVSQFFGNSHDIPPQQEEEEELQRSRSPSPTPMEINSNRTSVDGMDPAFANVLRRTPSNGSYTGSPLRQAVLGRSARGRTTGTGRRPRGGVPFKEARPPSIVAAPEVLAAELGGFESSPLKGANTSLFNDTDIIEEDDDDAEYIRVKRVEKAEFGCQTEAVEEEKTVVLAEPPVVAPAEPEVPPAPVVVHVEMGIQSDPEIVVLAEPPVVVPAEPEVPPAPVVVHVEMGTQSDPEPEPVLPPKPVMADMSLQTEPEPVVVVEKAEMGIQHHTPEPVLPPAPVLVESSVGTDPPPPAPVLVDSGIGTDPLPEPALVQSALGKGLPPLVIADTGRRSTITQADISRTNSSGGDSTITRSFLSHQAVAADDEIDEGEETETGAETEDDYHDARQSIMMSTPSEDFHSVRTMTDNDYSDSEDDAESIKASHFSSRHHRSTSSLDRPPTSASSYFAPVPIISVTYESVGVTADLYEPPEPVVVEVPVEVPVEVQVEVPVEVLVEVPAPKPEVKEMSIQTDEWKPPAPAAPAIIPAPSPKPGLYRVGSTNHQFQFIPPPPSAPPTANGLSASAPAPVFTAPSPVNTPMSSVFREPSASGTLGRRTTTDRRSIESLISSSTAAEDPSNRSRVLSSSTNGPILTSMDKTRPPMMSLPPPPKLPPPPSSMPPPNFIPERRLTASGFRDGPPPRPSSPPPAELIQRATTPLGSILSVPGAHSIRSHASSMPPSQANLRQPPSTSSFRSAANTVSHAYMPPSVLSSHSVRERERNARSSTSLTSDHSGVASPRSSMSSDRHQYDPSASAAEAPTTPDKSADITPRANNNAMSTDPAIIHAITQTMIGEFLYKYTRKAIGKGVGERRHKRFFWVHPYTKTLYWSSADPGSSNVSESSAKSAYIEGVRSVLDPNPMPPGLYQYSVIVSTPQREMKITALTKERHDIWLNALKYLLARPDPNVMSPGNNTILPKTPDNTDHSRRPPLATSPQSQRSARSAVAGEPWNTTPRGQRSRSQLSMRGSASKRSGTPALEYLRWNAPESPYSPDRSFVDVPPQDPDELDFELHDDTMSDGGYEGLENVRACCDGRHTVGHNHHHHHHQQNPATQYNQGTVSSRRSIDNHHLEPNPPDHVRPSSPAWSFRSRTGSAQSHEAGGGIFSWGRGDDGKLRFGSRRSTKTSVPAHD